MKRNNLMVLVALILGGAFILAVLFLKPATSTAPSEQSRVPADKLIKPYNHTLGNQQAKVTVVEYLDPECPTCAAVSPMVKGLINDNKDRVRLVVRYMLFHHNSKPAALAIEAAGKQDKYWEMLSQLFYRRDWAEQETPQDAFFEKVAHDLGLDMAKFKADLKDPQLLANITADAAEGPLLGVQGTPTFFVNGIQQQNFDYDSLKKAIDDELAKNP